MSFPEILTAARALPQAEKLQLVHALVDDVGGAKPPPGQEIPPELAQLLRPGAAYEIWSPTIEGQDYARLMELLNPTKASP